MFSILEFDTDQQIASEMIRQRLPIWVKVQLPEGSRSEDIMAIIDVSVPGDLVSQDIRLNAEFWPHDRGDSLQIVTVEPGKIGLRILEVYDQYPGNIEEVA